MEEQMQTTPELSGQENSGISAEVTGNETGGAISGETLFEQYENGASVEALNELLAQTDSVSDEVQTGSENSGTQSKPESSGAGEPNKEKEAETEGSEQHDKTKPENSGADSRETTAKDFAVQEASDSKKQERTFTQRDVDYMIGKKTSELTRKHSALLDDLSALLGVERDEVTNMVRRQRFENEAESAGVIDKELYVKYKDAAEQLNKATRQHETEQRQARFYADINSQIAQFQKKVPTFDMNRAVDNEQFSRLLSRLYEDESVRDNALEMAYNAVFFDDMVRQVAQSERDKVISSVRSGQMRISEGAAQNAGGAAVKLNVGKMTDEQIAEMAARALNGEQIEI